MHTDSTQTPRSRLAVFVSGHGRGTNLQALIDACATGEIRGEVALVIGVRQEAPAMDRARLAGARVEVIPPPRGGDPASYGASVLDVLRSEAIDIVCLAGYMRLMPNEVVVAFRERMLNVHPALLPLFGGRGMYGEHVHSAVIASGMKVSGCTVHFVDDSYDTGPIILQSVIPVLDDDTPATLAARLLPVEHETYVRAVRLVAEGRVRVVARRAIITDNAPGA